MKTKLVLLLWSAILFSCSQKGPNEKELQALNQRSDSLSIKLNSPELKAVNKELVQDPNNAELYNKRANIYLHLKQHQEALNDAKLAVKIDSTIADFYLTMVDAYFVMNNTRSAKETLLAMERKFPDNGVALLKLAELYYLVKQYQESITYINKSLRLDETQAKAYHLKGNVYLEIGDTSKAISSFQTAIEQDNAYVDAFYDLGMLYGLKKDPLALDYYTNALKISPSHEQSLYARAKFFQDLGKYDDAIRAYTSMVTIITNCEQCHYNLGAIYLDVKKDYTQALEEFSKAIRLNPNYLEAYFARGFTYSRLNNVPSAKADYNMCLKLEPNYELAIEGLNNLK
jgi:tetratricopeptide (TPR) repeat protein